MATDPLAGTLPVKAGGTTTATTQGGKGAPPVSISAPATTTQSTTPGLNAAEEQMPLYFPVQPGDHGPGAMAPGSVSTVGGFIAFVMGDSNLQNAWAQYLVQAGVFTNPAIVNGSRQPTPAELRAALESVAISASVNPDHNLDSWLTAKISDKAASATGTQQVGSARFFKGTTTEIALTQPGAVESTGNVVAQQLIGRRLTADEVTRITNAINAQEVAEGTVRAGAAQAQQAGLYEAYTGGSEAGGTPTGPPNVPNVPGAPITGTLGAFMAAEREQESGNYNQGPNSDGAKGAYQILESNWPQWSQEAGLGPNAPWTAANQDKVAAYKFNQLYNDLGHNWQAVAVAWYAGEETAKAWLANPHDPKWDAPQPGGNPSINAYAGQVMSKFSAQSGATGPGPGIAKPGTPGAAVGVPGGTTAAGATTAPVGGPGLPTSGVPAPGTYTMGQETTFNTPTGTDYVLPAQAAVAQAPLTPEQMTTAALMNYDAPEYQAHNLLNVFDAIGQALGAGTPGAGKGVLDRPVKAA